MGGTVTELVGKQPSNIGVPACKVIKVTTDSGENFSEPFLLEGRKISCLHAPDSLTTTDIEMQGSNFSSRTTRNANADYDGDFLIPLDADFDDLFDESDTQVVISASDGERIWSCPDFGFPLWGRLNLTVAQDADFYIVLKG